MQTAGYVGDAISAGGSAYFAQRNQDALNALEAAKIKALSAPALVTAPRATSSGVSNGSPFSSGPVVRMDERPKAHGNPVDWIFGKLSEYSGRKTEVDPLRDYPVGAQMGDEYGNVVDIYNPDIFDDGPASWYNMGKAGILEVYTTASWAKRGLGSAFEWLKGQPMAPLLPPGIRDSGASHGSFQLGKGGKVWTW